MEDDAEREEAQLWALYFGMRGLKNPPPFLRSAQADLRRHLDDLDPPLPPGPPRQRRLHLVR